MFQPSALVAVLVAVLGVFSASFTFAAAPTISPYTTTTISYGEWALAESQIQGTKQDSATDAQVAAGFLSLKDPRPEVVTRSWKYTAGFSLQNFQTMGKATNDAKESFNLDRNDSTVMPGLVAGVIGPDWKTGPVAWKLGAATNLGFATQEVSAIVGTGFIVRDARLNTMLWNVGPSVAMSWEKLSWLSLVVAPQYGGINYTQASSNNLASFSKYAAFQAVSLGLDFSVGTKWSLFTEWSQRDLLGSDDTIAIQNENFALGTKATW